jgi:tetratricopeptide (TPR) repeat protein
VYALSALGLLEYERGNYAAALAHAERACLTSVPESQDNQRVRVEAEVLRGQALGQLGRWEESIRILRNALPQLDQIEPGYAAELKGMAESFLGLGLCAVGQFEEALEILGRARLDRAKQPGLWAATRVWLGNLYYLRDDYPNALEQYEAIADRPAEEWAGSRESLARMADCYLETGRPERGLQVAEEAYREMRGNPLVHIVLAKALAIASRWEQADAVLHELNEDNLEEGLRQRFYAHAAYVAAGRGDRHRADHWLRRLRLRNPNSRYLGPIQDAIDRIGKRKSGFFGWLGRQN